MPMNENEVVDVLILAMKGRGKMGNQAIYRAFERVSNARGRKLAPKWQDQVREVLQAHCAGTPTHERRGRPGDYFVHHARGFWSCKVESRINDLLDRI
jgi:hypothetical protein